MARLIQGILHHFRIHKRQFISSKNRRIRRSCGWKEFRCRINYYHCDAGLCFSRNAGRTPKRHLQSKWNRYPCSKSRPVEVIGVGLSSQLAGNIHTQVNDAIERRSLYQRSTLPRLTSEHWAWNESYLEAVNE